MLNSVVLDFTYRNKNMDLIALVDQINLATRLLSIDDQSDMTNAHAQPLQSSDRERLLVAARGLLCALEDPHKKIVEISKGVCEAIPAAALSEFHLSF